MKKKPLILILLIAGAGVFLFMMYQSGIITFDTYSANNQTATEADSVEMLTNGCYYVWHNDKSSDIEKDLTGTADSNVFRLCPSGDLNWEDDTFVNHTVWFTTSNDKTIPTLSQGDKLLYISPNSVPFEGIYWERFADYGYTIGVANMIGDESGHYHIVSDDGESYFGYIYSESDANELNKYASISSLFLDKVGGISIRDSSISSGGTVLNLEKDEEYVCEWYTGTYYQDFKLKANVHTFSHLEEFTTYDYEFLHSNVIEITIPDWLKTGYYYIENVGMFRYVADSYLSLYNGKPYDANVYWNDPIILYDEYGNLIYNPATGVDKTNEENTDTGTGTGVSVDYTQSDTGGSAVINEDVISDAEVGDVGADAYEINNDVEYNIDDGREEYSDE